MPCLSSKKTAVLIGCIVLAIILLTGVLAIASYLSWQDIGLEDAKDATNSTSALTSSQEHELEETRSLFKGKVYNPDITIEVAIHRLAPAVTSQPSVLPTSTAVRPQWQPLPEEISTESPLNLFRSDGRRKGSNHADFSRTDVPVQTAAPPSAMDYKSIGSTSTLVPQTTMFATTADRCEAWYRCEEPFLRKYKKNFKLLPSCPCKYPHHFYYEGKIYDKKIRTHVMWRVSPFTPSQMKVYQDGAERCIQSDPLPSKKGFMGAQNCCYDNKERLVTRGSGAGRPILVSPLVSKDLHKMVDLVPWMLCKGDWTKYNKVHPPNNDLGCKKVPRRALFLYQAWRLKQSRL